MHSAARVAELVATVEPQYVLVAADAGADFGASLTALDALDQAGVAVDAIALDGAARRERRRPPSSRCPVPVSWVDGRPATPGAWIGLLMDVLSSRTAATPRSPVLTPAGMVIALLLSAPALYDVTQGSLGLAPALLRLLAAFAVVAVGTAVLRRVMAPQPPDAGQAR